LDYEKTEKLKKTEKLRADCARALKARIFQEAKLNRVSEGSVIRKALCLYFKEPAPTTPS